MGLFSRRRSARHGGELPSDIVELMQRFGRHEFDIRRSSEQPEAVWTEIQAPLHSLATADPFGFTCSLAAAVVPVGGWAAFGGACTAWELLTDEQRSGRGYEALLDAAITFLRENGIPPAQVKGYIWERWTSRGGTAESWIPPRPAPSPDEVTITPIRPGEVRVIARLTAEQESNAILVQLGDAGEIIAVVDSPRSDEDPRRSRWEWTSAPTLFDLYREVGSALQVPPHWHDPELSPFIPLPRPRI